MGRTLALRDFEVNRHDSSVFCNRYRDTEQWDWSIKKKLQKVKLAHPVNGVVCLDAFRNSSAVNGSLSEHI